MEVDALLNGTNYTAPTQPTHAETAVSPETNGAKKADIKILDGGSDKNGGIGNSSTNADEKAKVPFPSEGALKKEIDEVNKKLAMSMRRLDYSIHEKTKHIMVKVVDTQNDEVIREIPSEESLDFLAHVLERSGILVDKKS